MKSAITSGKCDNKLRGSNQHQKVTLTLNREWTYEALLNLEAETRQIGKLQLTDRFGNERKFSCIRSERHLFKMTNSIGLNY